MLSRFATYFAVIGYVAAVYSYARTTWSSPTIRAVLENFCFTCPHDVHGGPIATLLILAPIEAIFWGVAGLAVGLAVKGLKRAFR